MSHKLADAIRLSRADEIVIVGMEPFFNTKSRSVTSLLCGAKAKRVSVITNAMNVHRASGFLKYFYNIDISMDAGPRFWEKGGRGSFGAPPFQVWLENILKHRESMRSLCVLNALYQSNCDADHIDDMMEGAEMLSPATIMFSLFVNTGQAIQGVSLSEALAALAQSEKFKKSKNAILLVDRYHLDNEGISYEEAEEHIAQSEVGAQVELLPLYPHEMGILRISASGLAQTTYDALWGPCSKDGPRGIQLIPETGRPLDVSVILEQLQEKFPYKRPAL